MAASSYFKRFGSAREKLFSDPFSDDKNIQALLIRFCTRVHCKWKLSSAVEQLDESILHKFMFLSSVLMFQSWPDATAPREINIDGKVYIRRAGVPAIARQWRVLQNVAWPVGLEANNEAGASRFHGRQIREKEVRIAIRRHWTQILDSCRWF